MNEKYKYQEQTQNHEQQIRNIQMRIANHQKQIQNHKQKIRNIQLQITNHQRQIQKQKQHPNATNHQQKVRNLQIHSTNNQQQKCPNVTWQVAFWAISQGFGQEKGSLAGP